MRRFLLLLGVVMLGLVIACGGGDDGDDNGDGGNGDDQPSSSAGNNDDDNGNNDDGDNDDNGNNDDDSPGSSGGSSDSEFCSPDNIDSVFDSINVNSLGDLSDLQSRFEALRDTLNGWADNAPDEIKDDVALVAETMSGFIDLLTENDFNFLSLGTNAADDPRFLALDDQEFTDAADRVSEFCGFDTDTFDGNAGSGGNPGGGGNPGFSVDLPDDFPSELVPPNSTVGFVGDVGFGLTAEFTSDAAADEMKAYYEAELGEPTFADAQSVLWSTGARNVTISGSDGNLTIIVIIIAS